MDMAVNKLRAPIRLAANFPWKQATAVVAHVGIDCATESELLTTQWQSVLTSVNATATTHSET